MCGFGVQTQNHLETYKFIYPVGCADKAVMWIESHLLLVAALTLGLALPQVHPCSHTQLLLCINWLQCCDISNPERVCAEITPGFSYLPSLTHSQASPENFGLLKASWSTYRQARAPLNTVYLGGAVKSYREIRPSIRTLHPPRRNTHSHGSIPETSAVVHLLSQQRREKTEHVKVNAKLCYMHEDNSN